MIYIYIIFIYFVNYIIVCEFDIVLYTVTYALLKRISILLLLLSVARRRREVGQSATEETPCSAMPTYIANSMTVYATAVGRGWGPCKWCWGRTPTSRVGSPPRTWCPCFRLTLVLILVLSLIIICRYYSLLYISNIIQLRGKDLP